MNLSIRKALRSEAKPLIGLYAESGAGKTFSALQLARGFVGPSGRIGMIETESGRGEAHVDSVPGGFDVISMRDDFAPRRCGDAITLAEASNLDALIVDSASHEWEGIGGVLHMAAANMDAGKKGLQVWQQPKIDHQRHFVGRLLQTPIKLVIVCMRAKYPMAEITKNGKKELQRSEVMEPKQSEDILFEMFVHGWIGRDDHAFHGTKYTRPELANVIKSGEPISIATGEALARWAAGGKAVEPPRDDRALGEFVGKVKAASSLEALNAIKGDASALPEADKAAARIAFKERFNALQATHREPGAEG